MKLEQSFEVEAPLEAVWAALVDVERVAPCLPGAEITESDGETYKGNFKVKLGPTSVAYRGTLQIESRDDAAHVATMRATGQDRRGQGSARATIVSTLSEAGSATRVEVVTDYTITGKLARFGRGGMMEDISKRLMRDFGECLQATIGASNGEAPAAAEPTPAGGTPSAGSSPTASGASPPAAPSRPAPPIRPAKPISGIRLFLSVLLDRLRRLLGRSR